MAGTASVGNSAGRMWYVDLMVAAGLSGVLVFSSFQMHLLLRLIALVIFGGGVYYSVTSGRGRELGGRSLALALGAVLVGFGTALLVSLVLAEQLGQSALAGWITFVVLAAVIYGLLEVQHRLEKSRPRRGGAQGPDVPGAT